MFDFSGTEQSNRGSWKLLAYGKARPFVILRKLFLFMFSGHYSLHQLDTLQIENHMEMKNDFCPQDCLK